MSKKLWGGRFKEELAGIAKRYSYSLGIDKELLPYDIKVNIAHVKTLLKGKVITSPEAKMLVSGLEKVKRRLEKCDILKYCSDMEDIHSLIQAELEKEVGAVAKKLHTARSRNDQVITSVKLYVRDKVNKVVEAIENYQYSLIGLADKNKDVFIPAYTHLKRAQVVLFPHHLLAYVEMAERDKARFLASLKISDELPLGSGAVAGLAFPLDRAYTAKLLGFSRVTRNSMDSVASRDFIIEFLSNVAIVFSNISRLCEDFILWNSEEFSFIEISDKFATGSSIMPHKKNPDMFELARGRVGKVYGNLISLLTTMKGLPLSYNRDMQEDKEALFSSLNLTLDTLNLFAQMLPLCKVNREKTGRAVSDSLLYATDLMDYLVKKGVPLKDAHTLVGKIVAYAVNAEKSLKDIPVDEYRKYDKNIDSDVYGLFKAEASVDKRMTVGSTNKRFVFAEISRWKRRLKNAPGRK